MARSERCCGCKEETSYVCAAQFCDGPDNHLIICFSCWEDGLRCFYSSKEGLVASKTKPSDEYREAKLYYDEGGFVTGGAIPRAYPSQSQ